MLILLLSLAAVTPKPSLRPVLAHIEAWHGCVESMRLTIPVAFSPEAAADHVLKQCEANERAVVQAYQAFVAHGPAERQAEALRNFDAIVMQSRARLVEELKAERAALGK